MLRNRIGNGEAESMAINSTNSVNALPNSLWHSPVPYLLGGVCVIVLLLAVAFILLLLSSLKIAHNGPSGNEGAHMINIEDGEKNAETKLSGCDQKTVESVIVVMAGDEEPSFLATPIMLSESAKEDVLQMAV
ncbi:hypothetical protein SUGI_0896050 [Cryptomeria japonica]|uniref:protein GLUTAMINE DUMPER 4-like n=1 Tax=Cryptomeria japonica TaxID=3369 RepID=UPI002414A80E|nr:protein GLUTAMINE DUMPER 4-like [Cryptomeria japonica]GLJ43161.1 hypothetical protein SUGI_0896050 [Cryptomeria japonica]